MLKFSFCWAGRREGESEKEEGRVFREQKGPWLRVTESLSGQIPGKKSAKLCGGNQVEARKRQGKKFLGVPAEGLSPLPRAAGSALLSWEAAPCDGWVLLLLSFFRFGNWCRTHHRTTAERREKGDKPVVKARVCHYILKMWCGDSQTEGSWTL